MRRSKGEGADGDIFIFSRSEDALEDFLLKVSSPNRAVVRAGVERLGIGGGLGRPPIKDDI